MRNNWLDIAKGITILLMVFGHSSIPLYLSNFIWAFHMPLFFIATGWSTNWTKRTFGSYVFHRIKTLLIPFITYSILVCIALNNHKDWKGMDHLLTHGWEGYPLWFVPVLFVSSVLCRAIYLLGSKKLRICLIMSMLIIGMVVKITHISLPWTMSSVPYCTFLIAVGDILCRYNQTMTRPNIFSFVILTALTLLISIQWRLDIAWNSIIPVIPLTIGAISGTYMMFMFSALIDQKYKKISEILSAIGRETYVVVAFASAIIMMLNQFVTQNAILKYLLLILVLFIMVRIKHLVNKYLHINIL